MTATEVRSQTVSATGTRITKKSPAAKTTVEVASGTDGRTTISSLAAAREAKLAVARAAVALDTEQVAAVPVGIPKALNLVPTPKTAKNAKKATAAAQVVKTAERVEPEGSKLCRKCSTVKPLDEFAKDKSSKDGAYSQCKSCEAAWRAAKKAATAA